MTDREIMQPEPPPECKTEQEKTAYAFGWWKAMEAQRLAQPEQEPVAWLSTDSIGERHLCFDKPLDNDPVQPLYTTPPQRTEPLTDGELADLWYKQSTDWMEFARAIEAAHGIKENT